MLNKSCSGKNIIPINDYNINIVISLFDNTFLKTNENNESNEITITNLFWFTNPYVFTILINHCKKQNYSNILEIGPGSVPFPLAKTFIGSNEKIQNYIEIDINCNKLPFENNYFDFVYCRHVLEDIQSPDFALKEIFKVSSSGYFETPSPLVELTKGVDSSSFSDLYIGYMHHRYIIWTDLEKNTIYMLPKYGFLENCLHISPYLKKQIINILDNYPVYWNTYFIWNTDNIEQINIIIYNNGVNIGIKKSLIEDYAELLNDALETTIRSTNYFIKNYSHLL